MKLAAGGGEIARHGFADGGSAIQKLGLTGGAPRGEKAAHDDAAIEEVAELPAASISNGMAPRRGIPGAGEEARGGVGAIEIARIGRQAVQEDQRAGGSSR